MSNKHDINKLTDTIIASDDGKYDSKFKKTDENITYDINELANAIIASADKETIIKFILSNYEKLDKTGLETIKNIISQNLTPEVNHSQKKSK